MYGKLFASAFSGSMFGAGPVTFAVWAYVIANTDQDHHVEVNPPFVAAIIGCTPAEVEDALAFLTAPDPHSRSEEEDGRRLVQDGAFSYLVVNHAKYRAIKSIDDVRAGNRARKQKSREKRKASGKSPSSHTMSHPVTPGHTLSAHTETETETDTEAEESTSDDVLVESEPSTPAKPARVARHPTPNLDWVAALWNETAAATGLSQVTAFTEPRRKAAADRLREHGEDALRQVLSAPRESRFLRGENGRSNGHDHWRPNLDWFLKPANFVKTLEGAYRDAKPTFDTDADPFGDWS